MESPMKRALLLLALSAAPAFAQAPTPAPAGSNIGLTQYPSPTCSKPQNIAAMPKPPAPPEKPSETQAIGYNKQVDAYNAAMRTYNEQTAAFGACINSYIANGNADMQRIRAALDAAVASAKAP
jgi:hypothetical protein